MINKLINIFSPNQKKGQDQRQGGSFYGNDVMASLYDFGFSGETDPLQFGDTKIYNLDYYTLRERSWQLYVENEYAPIMINRLADFVIGEGLKLQAEPALKVLKIFGVTLDGRKWSDNVEALFGLYASTKHASWNNESNLHQLAKTVYVHSKIAGDILVINRIDKNNQIKVQLVDGANVVTPDITNDVIDKKGKLKDTRIDNGVEVDKKGQHVAYWVRKSGLIGENRDDFNTSFTYERIPAYGKTRGRRLAWLVYGNQYRIGQTRGMPMLTCIMQKIKQLDRYSKAELAAAEENAKIAMSIMHKEFSSGENPMRKTGIGARNNKAVAPPEFAASSLTGDQIAANLSKSTSGTVVNLGRGQEIKSHDTTRPNVNYGEFVNATFKYICAACDIPMEVGMMLFSNNYSASRAALKMFEHKLNVDRVNIAKSQFYYQIYSLFATIKTLDGTIKTKGFLKALDSKDNLFKEAYFKCRFIGKPIPNVDELKEVKASVEKINNALSTHEKETEKLGNGDFSENIERLKAEIEQLDGVKKTEESLQQEVNEDQNNEEVEDDEKKEE